MWNGAFSPRVQKYTTGGCSHGSVYIQVGEPEYGMAPVYVQFNHSCAGSGPAPSNATVYTFEVELDSFMDAEAEEAANLQRELDNMTSSEKLEWVNNNLVYPRLTD